MPLDLLFGVNSSTAFLVQHLLRLSESPSVFSYPPYLHPTQHQWQKPKLKSCYCSSVLHVRSQQGKHTRD